MLESAPSTLTSKKIQPSTQATLHVPYLPLVDDVPSALNLTATWCSIDPHVTVKLGRWCFLSPLSTCEVLLWTSWLFSPGLENIGKLGLVWILLQLSPTWQRLRSVVFVLLSVPLYVPDTPTYTCIQNAAMMLLKQQFADLLNELGLVSI